MKKLLLLFLISCLLLCSCDIARSDNGQTNEQTTTEETTEEVTTEEPIQLNFPTINTIEEYNYLLETVSMREDFITLEELPDMGDFASFKVYEKSSTNLSFDRATYRSYEYLFVIPEPIPGLYYDFYGDEIPYGYYLKIIEDNGKWEPAVTLNGTVGPDMRVCNEFGEGAFLEFGEGTFLVGDISYYYAECILQSISWKIDNYYFTLHPTFGLSYHGFSVFEPDKMEDGFVRDLLNAETAEAAIERFAAKLRGETNADGE